MPAFNSVVDPDAFTHAGVVQPSARSAAARITQSTKRMPARYPVPHQEYGITLAMTASTAKMKASRAVAGIPIRMAGFALRRQGPLPHLLHP